MWLSTVINSAVIGFIALDLAAQGLSVLLILTVLELNYCICKTGAYSFSTMAISQDM